MLLPAFLHHHKMCGRSRQLLACGIKIHVPLPTYRSLLPPQQAVADEEARLGNSGRILLRKSGTEPLLRVMAEAETTADCEKSVDAIIHAMRQQGMLVRVK